MNTVFIACGTACGPFWRVLLIYTSPSAIQLVESATFGCN